MRCCTCHPGENQSSMAAAGSGEREACVERYCTRGRDSPVANLVGEPNRGFQTSAMYFSLRSLRSFSLGPGTRMARALPARV